MNVYDLGDLVALTGRFYSDAALTIPADPTDVTLAIRDPARVITTPAPTRASEGVWTYSWIPTLPGMHEVNWTGTGDVVSADQGPVYVKVGIDPGTDLCTLPDVRQFLRKNGNDTPDDDILQQLIVAASNEITLYTSREFTPLGMLTRRLRVTPSRKTGAPALIYFTKQDLQSASAIVLGPADTSPTTLDATAWALGPENDVLPGTVSKILIAASSSLTSVGTWSTFGYAEVDVTGVWGAPAIPAIVKQSCVVAVTDWYRQKVTAFSRTFNEDGIYTKPAPLPDAVCGWLERFLRYGA